MTRNEFFVTWSARAAELKSLDARVDAAALITQILTQVELLLRDADDDQLTLQEAAAISGFTSDHLGRLIRKGVLRNYGVRHRPRVRRADLPRKTSLNFEASASIVRSTSKGQIARSVVNSGIGRHDG